MKKLTTLFLLLLLCAVATFAQGRGDELMKQAQSALDAKEYVKARYNFCNLIMLMPPLKIILSC